MLVFFIEIHAFNRSLPFATFILLAHHKHTYVFNTHIHMGSEYQLNLNESTIQLYYIYVYLFYPQYVSSSSGFKIVPFSKFCLLKIQKPNVCTIANIKVKYTYMHSTFHSNTHSLTHCSIRIFIVYLAHVGIIVAGSYM